MITNKRNINVIDDGITDGTFYGIKDGTLDRSKTMVTVSMSFRVETIVRKKESFDSIKDSDEK